MPVDGMIEDINTENRLATIKIKEKKEGREYVYSGLTDLFVSNGDILMKGEAIGKDSEIDENTKCFFMLYNTATSFPQFYENRLTFYTPKGTKTFIIANGNVNQKAYDPQMGNYILFAPKGNQINIYYEHLGGFVNSLANNVSQGELVGYTNSTGNVRYPQLSLFFESDNKELKYRVIYIKINDAQ